MKLFFMWMGNGELDYPVHGTLSSAWFWTWAKQLCNIRKQICQIISWPGNFLSNIGVCCRLACKNVFSLVSTYSITNVDPGVIDNPLGFPAFISKVDAAVTLQCPTYHSQWDYIYTWRHQEETDVGDALRPLSLKLHVIICTCCHHMCIYIYT